jgi:hypothetical protein
MRCVPLGSVKIGFRLARSANQIAWPFSIPPKKVYLLRFMTALLLTRAITMSGE